MNLASEQRSTGGLCDRLYGAASSDDRAIGRGERLEAIKKLLPIGLSHTDDHELTKYGKAFLELLDESLAGRKGSDDDAKGICYP
jgi:hypothetical protein